MTTPVFDASSTVYAVSTTVSLNKTANGSNRLAIIKLTVTTAITGLTITYGGVACTLVDSLAAASYTIYTYYFIAPPAGSTAVVASWTNSVQAEMAVCTYYNVNQSTPLGTSAKATGTSTTASVNVTSAAGELVCDAVIGLNSLAAGGGQTPTYDNSVYIPDKGSYKNGAASVTMSWTLGGSNLWLIMGVSIKPSVSFIPQMGMY